MTDQPDPLPVHEAQVRAYAAESGDPILRRALTAVLAEYDAMRPIVEAATALVGYHVRQPVTRLAAVHSKDHELCELLDKLVTAVEEGHKP